MSWMRSIFKTRSQSWIFGRLQPEQVKSPVSGPRETIVPDKHYLKVQLLSMRVVNVRSGIRFFHGAVHSHASLPHPDGSGVAEFNRLVTPSQLQNVDAERLDRVVQVNQTLFGPVPYRGGALDLEVGLFSIRSGDLTAPFLGLLDSLSKTAGVSFVAQALPFAEPLKTGIDLLTGSDDPTVLEVGFASQQWKPETGVWVNIRAKHEEKSGDGGIRVEDLSVEGDQYRLMHRGTEVSGYPYMLIEVSAEPTRPTFFEIPDVREKYAALKTAMRGGKVDEIHEALAVFRRTALTSGDLLFEDARALADRTATEVNTLLSAPAPEKGFAEMPGDELELPPLNTMLYD